MDSSSIIVNPFRYKFSSELTDELFRFAQIHQYEDRDTFKESWAAWLNDSDSMVQEEIDRLRMNNYRGDVLTKMYKSVRYYFRNKSPIVKEPAKRKAYDGVDHTLLEQIDSHIHTIHDLPPKIGFIQFCELHQKNVDDLSLKKKYKNRYYLIVRR